MAFPITASHQTSGSGKDMEVTGDMSHKLHLPENSGSEYLQDVLSARARSTKHMLFYPFGSTACSVPKKISYARLYNEAKSHCHVIKSLAGFCIGRPVLLHLEDHWDAIRWFWAVLFAHGIPVISSPLSNVEAYRNKHLVGLSRLLESPICITRASALSLLANSGHTLKIHTIESLESANLKNGHDLGKDTRPHGICRPAPDQPAALMLTSGSTGNAKAVRLGHAQMLAAVAGKMSMRSIPGGTFLNWIGMDHVAALVETHLPALCKDYDQVHVHAADLVATPSLFIELLSRHRVTRTFAPNFFLAQLVAAGPIQPPGPSTWNLSDLVAVISGGEANDLDTVEAATKLLGGYGAPPNVIQPGFGMTETCAGVIYNVDCPESDIAAGRNVASVGRCVPGAEMRVVTEDGALAAHGIAGELEVRGPVVFDGYYRNDAATAAAFASGDGWFNTGDQAIIDAQGNLCLFGRAKDIININGVKIVTAEVQAAIQMALRGTCIERVAVFPSRAPKAATEQITVAYIPCDGQLEAEVVAAIDSRIVQTCAMASTAGQPCVFGVGESTLHLLPVSALGKISGAKMRGLVEAGAFDSDMMHHRHMVDSFRRQQQKMTSSVVECEEEMLLRDDFAHIKGLDPALVTVDTPIFELGFNSTDLIRLKHRISSRLGRSIDTITLIKHPSVRELATVLQNGNSKPIPCPTAGAIRSGGVFESAGSTLDYSDYDPLIVLRSSGTKTPLWLIHPGVGEVLIFIGLTQHLRQDDRPVFALRARGFDTGQECFTSIAEAVSIYKTCIRRQQPKGPYAIAGYSYGAMLAFETAKALEASGETIGFLGSFNLPPHIKHRMRQLDWNMCLLHLAQFLGLIDEATVENIARQGSVYHDMPAEAALRQIIGLADSERLHELALDELAIVRWADIAYGLQSLAVDYEPSGCVGVLDIFHAEPLRVAASSRDEWVSQHLSLWQDFCRTKPKMHEVDGGHYTMIGPDNVASFAKTLMIALEARGI